MIEVLTAIEAAFNANQSTLSGIVGGLWADNPPADGDKVPRPYCIVYDHRGAQVMWSFSGGSGNQKSIESFAIQFSIEAGGKALAITLMEALIAVFDPIILNLSTGTNLMFKRRYGIHSFEDPTARDEKGNDVWQAVTLYDVFVQPA